MPTYYGNEYEEASNIAEAVLDKALKYVDRVLLTNADYAHVDTLITQHVKIQLVSLQSRWSVEYKDKTVSALEDMGNGLGNLGEACGKHSLHVKLVQP
tara:strand:+ start:972 stop:1265 length:294 start_codon:yes stop_codon:yes gene_type:complete